MLFSNFKNISHTIVDALLNIVIYLYDLGFMQSKLIAKLERFATFYTYPCAIIREDLSLSGVEPMLDAETMFKNILNNIQFNYFYIIAIILCLLQSKIMITFRPLLHPVYFTTSIDIWQGNYS